MAIGKLQGCQNESKPYIKLYSMERDIFDTFKFDLISGRFPENKNEIIISNHIITNGKVELKLGDKISFDIGKRETLDGYELNSSNPYNEEEGEKIVDAKRYDFTIVRNNRKSKLQF